MTARDPKPGQKKGVLVSLAMGALVVPLAAYGASSLVNAPASSEPASTSTTAAPVTASSAPTAPLGPPTLDLACGAEGMQLVEAEIEGSISDVQRAALGAIRDICADAGRPLPGTTTLAPPTTPATVAVEATAVDTRPEGDDDDDEDHDDDDDDHEDDD